MTRSFHTTRWSLLAQAGGAGGEPARAALSELCAAYWEPLYVWLRRQGRDADEAADLVQGFLAALIERGDLSAVEAGKGRFRAWLLVALRNHVANERDRERAAKRGGGRRPLELDALGAESRLALEPLHHETPERAFLRAWALAVIERARTRLADEHRRAGKSDVHDALAPCLGGEDGRQPYAEIARRLARSEGAVKVAVHRMRRRLGELLREEVAGTLEDPAAIDEELAALRAALGDPRDAVL